MYKRGRMRGSEWISKGGREEGEFYGAKADDDTAPACYNSRMIPVPTTQSIRDQCTIKGWMVDGSVNNWRIDRWIREQ